jgi:trk system potassium uptake protein TrkA
MKYIIVGLGTFGASLAEKLTSLGNEVIGIDIKMDKVDSLKEKITHTICMDATDEITVAGLPIADTDVVIISIGENRGMNVMVTALFKNLNAKRIISRSVNSLHEKVLIALGIDEIVHPEEETAERWAKKLSMEGVVDSFEVSSEYSIIEIDIPEQCIGKTVEEFGFRKNHNLSLLTTIKTKKVDNLLGNSRTIKKAQGVALPNLVLEKDDILVLYGKNSDIKKFL